MYGFMWILKAYLPRSQHPARKSYPVPTEPSLRPHILGIPSDLFQVLRIQFFIYLSFSRMFRSLDLPWLEWNKYITTLKNRKQL